MDYEWRKYSLVYKGKNKGNIPHNKVSETLDGYAYHFFPEIPKYVDGVTVNIYGFDTKQELVDFIKEHTDEDYTACMDSCGEIIVVHHDGHPWYVLGYTNLDAWTFPNWEDYRESDEAREKREKEAREFWERNKIEIKSIQLVDKKTGKVIHELEPKPVALDSMSVVCHSSGKNGDKTVVLQSTQNIDFALKNPPDKINEPIFTNISKKYPKE